jgi:outer membrane receptor for ferric coprogen and ferric-rhodotorulic acid
MTPTIARSLLATAAAAIGLGLGISTLGAQTAPTTPASSGEENTVKLDPFSVSASSDVGFVASSSLAGGRIATALKDTPVAYSVLTSEFLEAFNITDSGKAADFSVNTNQYYNDGLQGTAGNTTVRVRIRGQLANNPTRNFFPYVISSDAYNTDRMDFARGANASLFGAGGSAGTLNTVSKQALTNKTVREVRAQIGSWQRYRMTVDINEPLTEKVALRTNLLWSDGQTWKEREWERRKGIDLGATWEINSKLTFRAGYEFRTTDKNTGTNRTKDNTSAWDGVFMPSGPNPAMTAAQMARAGVIRQVQRYVVDPDNPRNIYNTQNYFVTRGAAYNATNPNWLNGKPIRSIGVNIGSIAMTEAWDHPDRFASVRSGAPNFVLLHRTGTPLWDVDYNYPSGKERGEDMSVFLTYRPFDGLFVEWSGDRNRVYRWTEYPAAGGMYNMQVDINRLKPDGSPNPYFLESYSENTPFAFENNPGYHSTNLQIAYVKDTRWGKLQTGLMGGIQNEDREIRQTFWLLPLLDGVAPGQDFRSYFEAADMNLQSTYTRQYTRLRGKVASPHPRSQPMTVTNYITGARATMTPRWYFQPNRPGNGNDTSRHYKFVQAVGNFNLFKNRLVLIGAARRDVTLLRDRIFKYSYDMSPEWRGESYIPRPTAPEDYWQLTYTPKNAAGVAIDAPIPANQRPRNIVNGVQVPAPQYANDRFQDDYSPPDVKGAVNTRTFGAVVNITSWMGIYGNNSTTFDLNGGNLDIRQQLIRPTSSQSYDAGIRFNLPNGKLNVSLGWYRAFQAGRGFNTPGGLRTNLNTISDTPVIGDLSEGGRNIRGLGRFPGLNIFSTLTQETVGYEFELTGNLTSRWRLILNAGMNEATQKDVMPDVPSWIQEKDPLLRQILADGGILINATTNQAFINPALEDPTKINIDRVTASVNAWNTFVNSTVPGILQTASTQSRLSGANEGGPSLSANIATDYRFTRGFLNGLRAGIALNYRGRQVLGARTGDTIPDPNNPNVAIPDPTRGATSYIWGGGYTKGTANFSYTYRLKENNGRFARYSPKTIQFDFAIDNLFNLDRPILENSSTTNSTANSLNLAPRDNDISNVGVMSIPGAYNWQPPRNYTLTAKLSF